ncbi:hypothetical protein [Paenibacillus protaetiae]|nr:hypothetical protein [Paenibacillus protaetiae]
MEMGLTLKWFSSPEKPDLREQQFAARYPWHKPSDYYNRCLDALDLE